MRQEPITEGNSQPVRSPPYVSYSVLYNPLHTSSFSLLLLFVPGGPRYGGEKVTR